MAIFLLSIGVLLCLALLKAALFVFRKRQARRLLAFTHALIGKGIAR